MVLTGTSSVGKTVASCQGMPQQNAHFCDISSIGSGTFLRLVRQVLVLNTGRSSDLLPGSGSTCRRSILEGPSRLPVLWRRRNLSNRSRCNGRLLCI